MNINLHIDRLIIDSVAIESNQYELLKNVLVSELSRSITDKKLMPEFTRGMNVSKITAPGISLDKGNDTLSLGQKIARSVAREVCNE